MKLVLTNVRSVSGWLDRKRKITNPIRWMGCSIALYDCSVQMKADMRGRKVLCRRRGKRRGTKSRGSRKNRAERKRLALVSAAPSPPGPSDFHAAMVSAEHRLGRISYQDRRFDKWLEKLKKLVSVKLLKYESLRENPVSARSILRGESRRKRLETLRKCWLHSRDRLASACAGHWGLPKDLALKRSNMVLKLGFAIPRIPADQWTARGYGTLGPRPPPVSPKRKSEPCRCVRCRVSTLCPSEHGLGAGLRTCAFCDYERHAIGGHTSATSFGKRGSGRVSESKRPGRHLPVVPERK